MTASGPFALGPAMAGSAATKRTAPRSNFTPIMPGGAARGALGVGLTSTTAPSIGLKREPGDVDALKMEDEPEDEAEVYSDPDEGVEIVDMENVRGMDWMAPESLKKEKDKGKGRKKRVKEEEDKKGKGVARADVELPEAAPRGRSITDVDGDAEQTAEDSKMNPANALNLSDSEEEEELEDMINDFSQSMDMDVVSTLAVRLYASRSRRAANAGRRHHTRAPLFLPVSDAVPAIFLAYGSHLGG